MTNSKKRRLVRIVLIIIAIAILIGIPIYSQKTINKPMKISHTSGQEMSIQEKEMKMAYHLNRNIIKSNIN